MTKPSASDVMTYIQLVNSCIGAVKFPSFLPRCQLCEAVSCRGITYTMFLHCLAGRVDSFLSFFLFSQSVPGLLFFPLRKTQVVLHLLTVFPSVLNSLCSSGTLHLCIANVNNVKTSRHVKKPVLSLVRVASFTPPTPGLASLSTFSSLCMCVVLSVVGSCCSAPL